VCSPTPSIPRAVNLGSIPPHRTCAVDRSETINLTVAAVVTQVLPNGNLVIQGRQEVRGDNSPRAHRSGIVRPEDISNVTRSGTTQIAEPAFLMADGPDYDVQQPRYGQQFLDCLAV